MEPGERVHASGLSGARPDFEKRNADGTSRPVTGTAGPLSRRQFVSGLLAVAAGLNHWGVSGQETHPEPIIDDHQHLNYAGRSDEVFLEHQKAMGIAKTILLPAGRPVNAASTHDGVSNGLQAKCAGNEACYQFAKAHPENYFFGANEVPDLPEATKEIEKYLKLGAVVIGEQKFGVEWDTP